MMDNTSTVPPADRLDLGVVFKALWRGLPFILLISIAIAGLVFAFGLSQPPVYRAETSLLIEDRENPFTRARGVQVPNAPLLADDSAISSQMQLLQTDEALRQIAAKLDLVQTQEYQKALEPQLLDGILTLLGQVPDPLTEQDIKDAVITKLRDNVVVLRNRDSRIISVVAGSEDPAMAAKIANELAQEHVRRRSTVQAGDTLDATKWLEDEIAKLRESVLSAETKVADFRAQNDLFRGPDNAAIDDRRLSDLSVQITQASGRRNVAESKAKLIRTLIEQNRPLTSVPDVQNSRLVQALTQQLIARRAEVAQLSATFLPNHPSVAGVRAQVRELEGQIRREALQVARTLETEASIEQELVQSLEDDVARAKVAISQSQAKQVQLNELEREASAQRDLLNTMLSRYREASSRATSRANPADVRVISAATIPTQPYSPKIVQMTILGFVAGFVLSSIWVMGRSFSQATRPNPQATRPNPQATRANYTPNNTYDSTRAGHIAVAPEVEPVANDVLEARRKAWVGKSRAAQPPVAPRMEPHEESFSQPMEEEKSAPVESQSLASGDLDQEISNDDQDLWGDDQQAWSADSEVSVDQAMSDADKAVNDLKQEISDDDQALWGDDQQAWVADSEVSNLDQVMSDADKAVNDLDQEISDNDQALWGDDQQAEHQEMDLSQDAHNSFETQDDAALPNPLTEFASRVRSERVNQPPRSITRLRDELETNAQSAPSKRESVTSWRAELMAKISENAPDQPVLLVGTTSAKLSSNDCVLALARDYIKNGAQVLIIDASPSRFTLDLNDDVNGLLGLSDLLAGEASFEDVMYEDRETAITFIPTGQKNLEIKKSPEIDILLKATQDVFDKVLVSTGPIGLSSGLPLFRGTSYATAMLDPDGGREQGQAMVKAHLQSFGLGSLLFVHYDDILDQHIA